jgi:glycosyltransferase involved in cell wall biosynthesis
MVTPEISIGVPVYNGASAGLSSTLRSILSQSFEDFELIISDNASTDETREICQGYARRDRRVRYHVNDANIGAGANYNRVFELSCGRFFKWAAADVQCLPGMLQRCYDVAVDSRAGFSLVYPRCQMVDLAGKPLKIEPKSIMLPHAPPHRRMMRVIESVTWVSQLYGLMPRDILRRTRLMDSFASSDWVLLAELAILGEIREIPEVLLKRSYDPTSGSAAQKGAKNWSVWLDTSLSGERFWLSAEQRVFCEYMRSAWRLGPGAGGKAACLSAAAYGWGKRRGRAKINRVSSICADMWTGKQKSLATIDHASPEGDDVSPGLTL